MAVNLGIIGFGRMGAEHARWIGLGHGLEVGAVFDATAARSELAQRNGLRTVGRIEQLLSDSSIDAILVSTPNSMHFEQALAGIRAGKHVMIEKPMTVELQHARQLVDEARQRKLVLSVFHNRRWDIDYLTVRHAVEEGIFGTVFNIESRLGQWASCVGPAAREWRPEWRNEAAFGGGGLLDWGSHFLDQLRLLMQPARPLRVFSQLRGNVWSRDCDDLARVCVDFDNGAIAMVEINTTTIQPLPRWHIDGSLGSGSSPVSLEYDTNVWARLTFAPADGGTPRELSRAQPGLSEIQIWEQFAAACRGEAEPAVCVESVLPTMVLLDAARRSSQTGRSIPVSGSFD